MCVGHRRAGFAGRPAVQAFLDACRHPLRSMHKVGPVIRLPLVLKRRSAGPVPLPGSAPGQRGCARSRTRAEQAKVAVAVVALTTAMVSTSLAWTGGSPRRHVQCPNAGREAADWLRTPCRDAHSRAGAGGPGRPSSPTQVWAPATTSRCGARRRPWGVRDSIPRATPLGHSGAGLVQRCSPPGDRQRAGQYPCPPRRFLVRNDLDPETSCSAARPILLHRSIAGSPG